MNCENCGQPMVTFSCLDCDACGWWYGRDEWGMLPTAECATCCGTGEVQNCVNRDCSSPQWYPAGAREQAILRMARREGGGK